MNKLVIASFPLFLAVSFSNPVMSEDATFRRSNFSNEFNIKTPEGINARGSVVVISTQSKHQVKINANGLKPGETYVILNHWFDPIPGRGVPDSPGALVDPSCNGHFQFLGAPVNANKKGEINVDVKVNQLAPHVWVANLAKFMEVTKGGTQAPANVDAFATGGLRRYCLS